MRSNFSTSQRTLIKCLTLAKPKIKTRYMICYALNDLRLHGVITKSEEKVTRQYLVYHMGGEQSVLAWLWNKKVIPLGQYRNTDPELIDYRERWIDQMIEKLQQELEVKRLARIEAKKAKV